jgi:hypothetical protein
MCSHPSKIEIKINNNRKLKGKENRIKGYLQGKSQASPEAKQMQLSSIIINYFNFLPPPK